MGRDHPNLPESFGLNHSERAQYLEGLVGDSERFFFRCILYTVYYKLYSFGFGLTEIRNRKSEVSSCQKR